MIWCIARWGCLSLLVLMPGMGLYLHFSAQAALDNNFQYSRQAAELPNFTGGNGLVQAEARGYTYRVRIAGFEENPGAPPVILLHGFPVTSAMWLPIIDYLVTAGFRVVAPDQRGYSPGARPSALHAYHVTELVADVLALADFLGFDQFHLVGHDWGAMVSWHAALTAPQRLYSLSALTVTHPAAFADALQRDPDQQRRSRYLGLISLPWLPETLMLQNDLARLRALGSPDWPEQTREYSAMFSEPGAATAALNWYRALPDGGRAGLPVDLEVRVPTLFIWGSRDEVLGPYSITAQRKYVTGDYTEVEIDAGHRLVQQKPSRVAAALVAHLRGAP